MQPVRDFAILLYGPTTSPLREWSPCKITAGPQRGKFHEKSLCLNPINHCGCLVLRPLPCPRRLRRSAATARFQNNSQETTESLRQVFQAAAKGHEEIGQCTAEGAQAGAEKKRP